MTEQKGSNDATKSFRFQGQRVMLTYQSHLPKEAFKEWAEGVLKSPTVHVAHETSDTEAAYDHTHVIMEWPKCFQTRDCRKFDYEDIHPHIKPITSREHLMNAYKYLCKQDHSCDYLLELRTSAFSRSVWSCHTLQEALGKVEKPADVLGTIAMFKNKPADDPPMETLETPRPWQARLLSLIAGNPDDRTIVWILDTRGGAGKSRLCRYLEDRREAIVLTGISNPRDIAQILRGRLDRGENPRVIIADLSRSYETRDIYNTLEMLKNGRMDSPKYEGVSLRWRPGHVIVMANFAPDTSKMTEDRWRIISVSRDEACPAAACSNDNPLQPERPGGLTLEAAGPAHTACCTALTSADTATK